MREPDHRVDEAEEEKEAWNQVRRLDRHHTGAGHLHFSRKLECDERAGADFLHERRFLDHGHSRRRTRHGIEPDDIRLHARFTYRRVG